MVHLNFKNFNMIIYLFGIKHLL